MNHDELRRKLSQLEHAIQQAQAASLDGDTLLSGISLTLNDALRVAANIRTRLSGATRAAGKQTYHVTRRPLTTD